MSHIQTPVSTVLEDMKQLPLFCRMKNQKRIKRDVAMKDDQRIALTKRLLREGLLRLLSKTDLNKISVTQLCIESGINRATFYRHYEEPRDILNDIKYEIFQEVAAFAEKAASKGDTRKMYCWI